MKRLAAVLCVALLPVLSLVVAPAPTSAAAVATDRASEGATDRRVSSRPITFTVDNAAGGQLGALGCAADRRTYTLRARLVGPTRVVDGYGGPETFHLLVHDAGTGGWFWHLRQRPAYDYATRLARRGETSVVLDRLGYDGSRLRDGDATCLAAQAQVVHQVVQHLYAGTYDYARPRGHTTPHAGHVVLHGHGTGATIARLEAAHWSDVQAVVLMSEPSTSPSVLALRALQAQAARCARGGGFAPFGTSAGEYRRLLFASAPTAVQRSATRLRNPTPCGDVASVLGGVLDAQRQALDVPALVLTGGRDARGASGRAVTATGGARLVRRSYAGAGSALPLERQAPAVRRDVLRFVRSLDDRLR
jgi:hypothetical protein